MGYFAPVLDRIKREFPAYDLNEIARAFEYARDAHEGQKRFSGEPYILHPVAVVDILLNFKPDQQMIIAALLHDVSEDTEKTLEDIALEFGDEVAYIVKGLEKLSKVRSRIDEPQVENLRKMFVHMAADLRIIVIKLCDRLHNMMTLGFVRPDKQERIARETLDVYVPIAARLGIYSLKRDLEDLCFEFLEPDEFLTVKEQLSSYSKITEPVIDEIKKVLQKELALNGYTDLKVEARLKSVYSTYCKMKRKGTYTVDDIYDIFGIRVILPDQEQNGVEYTGHLYAVLGVIHKRWTPLQTRFKDYVAVAKPNGYRSLHTTVIGLGPKTRNQPTEIQIRTQSMHEEARSGIASHWLYDETSGRSAKMSGDQVRNSNHLASRMNWVENLSDWQEKTDNNDFMSDLRADFLHDRIFVFTPLGDVKDLPGGATPIDFAYAVHSEVGHHCVMAKVNGVIVPLDEELSNGAVVEIITRENAQPNQYWLAFVKTSSAKAKIKNWFRTNADPQKCLREGREIINKHLEQISKPLLDKDLSLLKEYCGKRLTLREREELLRDVGRGMLLPNVLIKHLFPMDELMKSRERAKDIKKKRITAKVSEGKVDLDKEVEVGGYDDLHVRIASCCKPTKRDRIVGYVTRGRGVTVHKQWCKVIGNGSEDRFVEVNWKGGNPNPNYRVLLDITLDSNRIGLLSDVSNLTAQMGVNILGIGLVDEISDNEVVMRDFEVEVLNFDQLTRLIQKLQDVPSVKWVKKL